MSKTDILRQLSDKLSLFEPHERFTPELLRLLQKTSCKAKFFDVLINRLDFLSEYGRTASDLHKEFERIDQDIYSMHLVVPDLNLRILYSFLDDGTVLLCSFHERGGKRNTDYSRQLPVAKRRKQEMEGN